MRTSKKYLALLLLVVILASMWPVSKGYAAPGDKDPRDTFGKINTYATGLNQANGMALDAAGNIYVADTRNHVIRKIDKNKMMTVVAGTGAEGYDPNVNAANESRLNKPEDVAIDTAGNLYIADTGNGLIRKVNLQTNAISTVAGKLINGTLLKNVSNGVPATDVSLQLPKSIALDAQGNLYIASYDWSSNLGTNHYISKVTGGTLKIFAGNGSYGQDNNIQAIYARIAEPSDLQIDNIGNVYFAEPNHNTVRKIDTNGIISVVVGELNGPQGLALDSSNNLYIADSKNNAIRKVDLATKKMTTVAGGNAAGSYGDGESALYAGLNSPRGVLITTTSSIFPEYPVYGNDDVLYITEGSNVRQVKKAYTITYDGNGHTAGNPPVDKKAYRQENAYIINPFYGEGDPNFKKANHRFIGWNTKPDGTGDYVDYIDYRAIPNEEGIVTDDHVTVYAIWEIDKKSIIYNSFYYLNDWEYLNLWKPEAVDYGSSYTISNGTGFYDPMIGPDSGLVNIENPGHILTGWSTEYGGEGQKYAIGETVVITDDLWLYAIFEEFNGYTVLFDSKGGSPVASQTREVDTLVTEPTAPTKTGFTFGGWYKDTELNSPWNFGTDKVIANTTLHAKWDVKKYVVTFDSNGGSPVASQTRDVDALVTEPTAPTKTGFTFGGWYKDTELNSPWNFGTDKVTANTTLHAKWDVKKYVVTFDSNGGTPVASQTREVDALVIEPTAPTKTGFTFGGWYKDTEFNSLWNFATDKVTANTTLHAKWDVKKYVVTFESNGGTPVASQTREADALVTEPTAPTKTGFTFGGWYKDTELNSPWNFATDKVTANTTLHAKWDVKKYVVTFESNGGTPVASQTRDVDALVTEPTAPTKTGFTFGGWYKDSEFNSLWNFATDKVTANTTLHAKWDVKKYVVTFESNGGTPVASQFVEEGGLIDVVPLIEAPPTKEGYTFAGWHSDSTFESGQFYFQYGIWADLTLYAKWNLTLVEIDVEPKTISLEVGKTQQLTVKAIYSDGSKIDVTANAIYSPIPASIITVNKGAITGVTVGSGQLFVNYNGKGLSMVVKVTPVLNEITINPTETTSLVEGQKQNLSVTARYLGGSTSNITSSAVYSSTNDAVATVSATGEVQAVGEGTAIITATYNGKSATVAETVKLLVLEKVSVSPQTLSLEVDQSRALKVTESYSDGSEKDVTTDAEYISGDDKIATVDEYGVVQAVGAGTSTIKVTYNGETIGEVDLTVTPKLIEVVLEAISATPEEVSLEVGKNQQLTVTASYSDDSESNVTASAIFSTSNSAVATVSTAGVVQAVGAGTATITVTLGGKSVQLPVTVTPASIEVVLEAISATPEEVSLKVGENQQMTVTASYSDGSESNVTTSAVYSTSNSAVATVSTAGVVQAVGAGTATITITYNGKSLDVKITVTSSSGGNSGGGSHNGNNSGDGTTTNPSDPSKPTEPSTPIKPTPTQQPTQSQPLFGDKVNVQSVQLMVDREKQAPNVSFSDAKPTSWSTAIIERAARMGFVTGYENGTFKPNDSVTRAEFVTMVVKAFGLTSESSNRFNDSQGHWAMNEIGILQSLGIISGYKDGSFHPNQEITRAEIVVILSRLTNFVPSETTFNDVKPNNWATDAISAFSAAGIVSGKGDGAFKPEAAASRAESVAMIIRLIDKLLLADTTDGN